MKNELNCEIIKDLLPLYVDKLVSEETKNIVEEHIEECDNCKSTLEDINPEEKINPEDNIKQVDCFKKIKKKSRKKSLFQYYLELLLRSSVFLQYGCTVFRSQATTLSIALRLEEKMLLYK